MYDEVVSLLGLTDVDDELEAKLNTIISLTERRLRNLLGGTQEVPETLGYIVVEVSIRRYNRIGSEGLASHTVEGETMTWPDDDFAPYNDDIQAWLNANPEEAETDRGRVRFI